MKLTIATLDFTHVTNNLNVHNQGKIVCLRTSKGWFWIEKGKFPSRQDLAIVSELKEFDLEG